MQVRVQDKSAWAIQGADSGPWEFIARKVKHQSNVTSVEEQRPDRVTRYTQNRFVITNILACNCDTHLLQLM